MIIATGYVLTKQNAAMKRLDRTISLQHRSYKLADQLRQSSDDLTRMVRTYAATGDSTFEEYFYTILNIRDGKVPRPEHYDRIFWDFIMAGETIPVMKMAREYHCKHLWSTPDLQTRNLNS